MTKLYEVEIIIRAVIVADDDKHAVRVAYSQARAIVTDVSLDDVEVVGEIDSLDDLPGGWRPHYIPYGEHGHKSIAEFIAELPSPPPERDTKTIDMFAEAP